MRERERERGGEMERERERKREKSPKHRVREREREREKEKRGESRPTEKTYGGNMHQRNPLKRRNRSKRAEISIFKISFNYCPDAVSGTILQSLCTII